MAVWAYPCRRCSDDETVWYVSEAAVAVLPRDVQIVRVHVGSQWLGAILDRTRPVPVEGLLVRDVVASDEADCPECARFLAAQAAAVADREDRPPAREPPARAAALSPDSVSPPATRTHAMKVQAAAISLQGNQFVVVVVTPELVKNPGEADMAIEDLQPHFGGARLVLMAQDEEGTPTYYGDSDLVELLKGIPVDKMPWKEYPIK